MKLTATLALMLSLFLIGCEGKKAPAPSGGKLRVVATIFPIADVAANIGGADVEVRTLLKTGQSPHDYTATAQDAAELAKSQLLIMVGLGVDEWAASAAAAAGEQKIRVLELGEAALKAQKNPAQAQSSGSRQAASSSRPTSGSTSATAAGAQHAHAHVELLDDPHLWLDPVAMQRFVQIMADEFSLLDAAHKGDYQRRAAAYIAQLQQLDREYRQTLSGVKNKHFVTYHAAYTYIAKRYGLTQMSILGPDAHEFGTPDIGKVLAFMRQHDVKVVFAEPEFPTDRVEALAQQTGARIDRLDAEGGKGIEGYGSYLEMMRTNLKRLAAALGQ